MSTLDTLNRIAITLLEHDGVETACVSHFSNDETIPNWDAPTLWVHLYRRTELHELPIPSELVRVSDGHTDIGPAFGFQLA